MATNKLKYEGAFAQDDLRTANDNFRDVSLCTTQLDLASSTTLTNVAGMVTGILNPGTYTFRIAASTTATANTGLSLALKWGTASMLTSAQYTSRAFTASGVVVTKGTTATDAALWLDSAAGVVIEADITGVIVVALPGTLQLQMAPHSSNSDTASVLINSQMEFTPVGATARVAQNQ